VKLHGLCAALLLAACSPSPPAVVPVAIDDPPPLPMPEAPAPAATAGAAEAAAAARKKVHEMLARVAQARGLPIRREVASRVLDRKEVLDRIRAHVEREVPREAVENEGEMLAGLDLVPPDYDFVEGTYRLIQGRIAGFYEPEDGTMYLLDDLDDDEATETLAHELVHALQDQSFPLAPLLAYNPCDGDRISAAHALVEGDATSAMLDVSLGSAFDVSDTALRRLMAISNALSAEGAATPHALTESLSAPYVDGFAFVQERRKKGGWAAVDAAFRALPVSTEQILHPEKYDAGELPIPVAVPPIGALGAGFRAALDDVMGEQGLRIMLGEWAGERAAVEGAAGWGGDRCVVARRDVAGAPDLRAVAVGWRAVFDTPKDAAEVADILKAHFGVACRERPAMGPITWRRRGRDVVIAAGPYERQGKSPRSAGNCALASRWAEEMLRAGSP
jgi:hypothetical protein